MELLDYEKKHISYFEENAHEGTLFLKRDDTFPLKAPCDLVLVGNGARQTIKGGTGSGDVASRFFVNFEQGFENAGFKITSKKWLDQYDEFKKKSWKGFVKDAKKLAWKNHIFPGMFTLGFFEEEKNYPFDVDAEGDACIYVLSRNSGEGNDRRNIKGDVKLSSREIHDIISLSKRFGKFLLVLNVGGVIDLSPVIDDCRNILYISQLGVVTGDILPKIVLGKVNPSGKLTTTWAKEDYYPSNNGFGNLHDIYYKEGIYVGYRYFDSKKITPYFEFGYGVSYTKFEISDIDITSNKDEVMVNAKVTNVGKYEGKEVVQVYVSAPQGKLTKPYQSLIAYKKTSLLKPGEHEVISFSFKAEDLVSYNESKAAYVLEKGNYIIRVGNSSRNNLKVAYFALSDDVIIRQCENKAGNPGFKDLTIKLEDESVDGLKEIKINENDLIKEKITYKKDEYKDSLIEKLTDEQLVLLCLGNHKSGAGAMVGNSAVHVVGGAGETYLGIPEIKEYLTMADGPAGLRLKHHYGIDEKGIYDVEADPIFMKMQYFLPKIVSHFMMPPKNRHGKEYFQYTTAVPIGTSLAMSFNDDYLKEVGKIIAEEMEIFKVDLWLAPALNIHRSIFCGRNFEYYSEDPLVAGKCAALITLGVQDNPTKGTTIKHFCCNNKELNRNNANSHVSERALREIYLKGFEICIKESHPKALMTSYNLLNGVHTSEDYALINDILRCEWGYKGLVMTDWITSGTSWCMTHKYPAPYAENNILAGNDLTMPGNKKDEKYLFKSLKRGKITREDLIISASRIYRSIEDQKHQNKEN